MFSSKPLALACRVLCTLPVFLAAACGGDSAPTGSPPSAPSRQGLRDGTLYLVIDFERREFGLLQGPVPLWTLPFVNLDSNKVGSWLEAFQEQPPRETTPLSENVLLRSKSLLTDSVVAIVAEASGFDAHLLQRQIPARFILRWDDAALEVESPVQAGGESFKEFLQDARTTARRLFGEVKMTVRVDSLGALTLQRAAKPPILTIVRPPRKR